MKTIGFTIVTLLSSIFVTAVISADERPVTAGERMEIERVLASIGCQGGRFEFDTDDNEFEIENTVCADGRRHEVDLDLSFKIVGERPVTAEELANFVV